MNNNLYIAIEGADNTGKTTFINDILNPLLTNAKCYYYKEPNYYRDIIKQLINQYHSDYYHAYIPINEYIYLNNACLHILMADRIKQINEIKSKIDNLSICISDRCILSSYIYQFLHIIKMHSFNDYASNYSKELLCNSLRFINLFCENKNNLPDIIFVFNKLYHKPESNEFIDKNESYQKEINELYLNVKSENTLPMNLKNIIYHLDINDQFLDIKIINIIKMVTDAKYNVNNIIS